MEGTLRMVKKLLFIFYKNFLQKLIFFEIFIKYII